MSELRRSLDFLRDTEDRETREATVEELVSDAERIQGEAGIEHRRVQLPPELDERLGPRFRELGWQAEAFVVMAQHREPERAVDLADAEEAGRESLGGTAQVESVMTLPEHRCKGLASAVVLRAAAAAQRLYARLGFDPIGFGYARYLRPPASAA